MSQTRVEQIDKYSAGKEKENANETMREQEVSRDSERGGQRKRKRQHVTRTHIEYERARERAQARKSEERRDRARVRDE